MPAAIAMFFRRGAGHRESSHFARECSHSEAKSPLPPRDQVNNCHELSSGIATWSDIALPHECFLVLTMCAFSWQ